MPGILPTTRGTFTFLVVLVDPCYYFPWEEAYWVSRTNKDSYVDELKAVAPAFGYTADDIDLLIADGISPEDVEEYFYSGEC